MSNNTTTPNGGATPRVPLFDPSLIGSAVRAQKAAATQVGTEAERRYNAAPAIPVTEQTWEQALDTLETSRYWNHAAVRLGYLYASGDPDAQDVEYVLERFQRNPQASGLEHSLRSNYAAGIQRLRKEEREEREAERQANDPYAGLSSAVRERLAKVKGSDELDQIAPLEPFVEGLFDRKVIARTIGKTGEGKTYIMTDLACCIATGRDWHGRTVRRGRVIYVVAERVNGWRDRLRAWEHAYNDGFRIPRSDLIVWDEDIPQVADAEDWDTFVETCAALEPDLVILDTQDRITEGLSEISDSDMDVLVEGVRKLAAEADTAVFLVHHQGHSGKEGMGSSVVKRNLSTELRVVKTAAGLRIECSKQGDHVEFSPIPLKLESVLDAAVVRPRKADASDTAETGSESAVETISEPQRVELPEKLAAVTSFRYTDGRPGTILHDLARHMMSGAVSGRDAALGVLGFTKLSDNAAKNAKKAWKLLCDGGWIVPLSQDADHDENEPHVWKG